MERREALELVRKQLTEKRYIHTIGVMETAIMLAEVYHCDPTKAELAAIFHDYAKFRPLAEMEKIILEEKLPTELLSFNSELWHAPVGAYLVEKEIGIKDADILNAIRYHTSGRPEMSLLEKIIYVADYIEPGRQFPGVDEVREVAKKSIDKALMLSIQNTMTFLIKKKRLVFPLTLETYNNLVNNDQED